MPTIKEIVDVVAEYYSLNSSEICMKSRKREIVQPRQIAMFFAKKMTKHSLAQIAFEIGQKDHATVLHASKTVQNLMDTDRKYCQSIEEIWDIILERHPASAAFSASRDSLITKVINLSSENNKMKSLILKMSLHIKNLKFKKDKK